MKEVILCFELRVNNFHLADSMINVYIMIQWQARMGGEILISVNIKYLFFNRRKGGGLVLSFWSLTGSIKSI